MQIIGNPNVNNTCNVQSPVSFNGYLGNEYVRAYGRHINLRHETAFFREADTLEYIKDYLIRTFPNIAVKNILIGACSTGEDGLSMKMIMNKVPSRIVAFDLGKVAIKRAKAGYYSISRPIDKTGEEYISNWGLSAYDDRFLAFDSSKKLTKKEVQYRKAFNKIFKEVKTDKSRTGILNRIKLFLNSFTEFHFIETDSKFFKLKGLRKLNYEYLQGDIRDLDKITNGEKFLAFTFRNAFYHLITTNDDFRMQLSEKQTREILKRILPQINKALEMKGLFAIGKNENEQVCDMILLTKMLKEYGFKESVFDSNQPYCHIWKKVREC